MLVTGKPSSWNDTIPILTFSGRASRSSSENIRLPSMTHLLGTTLTKNNGPVLGRLNEAYVSLAVMPERNDGSRAITLDRYGAYEVRLVEFLRGDPTGNCLFWLELCCHMTSSSLDSCRCETLDDAEPVADHFIACAKQLYDKSK
jgi:hypothetical protein